MSLALAGGFFLFLLFLILIIYVYTVFNIVFGCGGSSSSVVAVRGLLTVLASLAVEHRLSRHTGFSRCSA